MSLSAFIIGDPHFKISNVREMDLMIASIYHQIEIKNPDFIVVLGDILDQHEKIHVSPLTRSVTFLSKLMQYAPTYVLIGNHDLKNNRQFLTQEHPFLALKSWGPQITIVDTTLSTLIKDQRFIFVPYVPPGRFMDALNYTPDWPSATCIFAHQEFKGAQMGAIVSIDGDKWDESYPLVISGHIHDYQELYPNLIYVGTPIQHSFGDRDDKTISIFSFDVDKKWNQERIKLDVPRKRIIHLGCSEVTSAKLPSNCDLKIVIRGSSGEIKAIMKHPTIESWKKEGHRIAYKHISSEVMDSEEIILPVSKAPLRFSTVLYNSIRDNPRLIPVYCNLFGAVPEISTLKLNPPKSNLRLSIIS